MNLLIVGNSHAACLIEAWRETNSRDSSIHLDFFSRGGRALGEFGIDGDRIYAPNDEAIAFQTKLGQKSQFCISDYDAIVVIGHELSAFRLIRILNRNHVLGWPYRNHLDLPVITECCLREALADSLHDISATRILQQIQPSISVDRQKLIALPQPYPSQIVLHGPAKSVGFARVCRAGIGLLCRNLFETVAAFHIASIGAIFIPQPIETVVEGLLTALDYTAGAHRLSDLRKLHPQKDELHANAAYGELILQQLIYEVSNISSRRKFL